MNGFWTIVLTMFGGLMLAGPGWAQQEAAAVDLPTLTVTGRKIEERLSAELAQYGHQVQVIEGREIERLGFADLSEALRMMAPGLHVNLKGRGDYSTYMMNGNYGAGILWLLDGVRLNNRLYGAAYIDTLSPNMIDRVEILFGGEGLFYGTNATSGVINVITKRPAEERSGQVSLTYGSDQMVAVSGQASENLGGNRLLVFGGYESWGGYRPFTDRVYAAYANGDPQDREYDRANIGLKYLREFGEEADRSLAFHLQRNSGGFDYAYPNYRRATNDREEYILTAKWDHNVNDNYSYYLKAYYHNWWTDYTRVRLDGGYQNNNDAWGYQDWGFNFLNSYRWDRGDEILVGVDYQNYWGKDEVLLIRPEHEEVYAFFVQFRPYFSFWKDWKVALGARYNYMSQNDSLVWNASSRMPFFDNQLFLRANVGTSFILPTAEQLYADEPFEKGNPKLKPQESFSATVGLGADWAYGGLEASGFFEEIDKRIALDANDVFQNIEGTTRIRGYTITGSLRPLDSLTLVGSYTWQKAKQDGREVKRNNIPRDFASLSLRWDGQLASMPVGAGVFAKYVGSTPAFAATSDPQTFGDYWLADLSLYAQVTDHSRVSLYLANLFDKQYPVFLGRATDAQGVFYYENPLGNPFSATATYIYSF